MCRESRAGDPGLLRSGGWNGHITFWEIIVIQFVWSSEKPIMCLEQKLSGSDLCPIKRASHSLSDDAVTTARKKVFVFPSNEIHKYITVSTV